jgi:hypothetical protein
VKVALLLHIYRRARVTGRNCSNNGNKPLSLASPLVCAVKKQDCIRKFVPVAVSVILFCLGSPTYAEDFAKLTVAIHGQPITANDIGSLIRGIISAHPTQVPKDPHAMPSDVDQNLGDWSRVGPAAQPAEDAFVAATALVAMDAGVAGQPWERLFRSTPADHASRIALGNAVVVGLKTASDQSAAFETDQAEWIKSHVAVGTTRHDAYGMLKSRDLVAYNPAFAESRAVGNSACYPDPKSGTWPYQNETVPKRSGLCAFANLGRDLGNPDAMVRLAGAFGLGCDESVVITIGFDSKDLVMKVTVDKPYASCY